jgi:hypothetical protein
MALLEIAITDQVVENSSKKSMRIEIIIPFNYL